jgi:sulfite exporter TauE/SafE
MTELLAGLALGLSGSAHCALMCGPLVLALHPAAGRRFDGRSCRQR